ncbi:MAG: VWA-like domain-containing protein [bacterium]
MQGLYLPSIISSELPEMIIAVDTSMSIRNDELAQFAAEISSILAGYQTTIHVVYCDARFQGSQTFSSEDLPITLESKGGGGTSFIPPFEWVQENGIMPACLIYLTDMKCCSFPSEPDFPVLWVSTIPVRQTPSFGEVIEMS